MGECQPNNCSTPTINHGNFDQVLGLYTNGSVVSAKCDHNYELSGKHVEENIIKCEQIACLLMRLVVSFCSLYFIYLLISLNNQS